MACIVSLGEGNIASPKVVMPSCHHATRQKFSFLELFRDGEGGRGTVIDPSNPLIDSGGFS